MWRAAGPADFLDVAIRALAWVAAPIHVLTLRPPFDAAWGVGLFSAMASMSGFMIAAVAIIIGVSESPRLRGIIGSPVGRRLVATMQFAAVAWALTGLIGLTQWARPELVGLWYLAQFFVVVSIGEGIRGLLWLSAALGLYQRPLP